MQYLFTERAHLMCPNMCFGITMVVRQPYHDDRIRACLEKLSSAHPFLNALLDCQEDSNTYCYKVTDHSNVELLLKNQEVESIDDPKIMEEYRRLTGYDWNLMEEGMLKLAAWRMGDGCCFLLVFHHLLADGRGALMLAEELADVYTSRRQPEYAEEMLISSVNDFPKDSRMPFISRILVNRANKAWAKELKEGSHQNISYQEYHAFAGEFLAKDPVRHMVTRMTSEELEETRDLCHKHQVTVNDYLLAKLMMEEDTEKVILACDLRDRLACYREGALGNYSTAFSIECRKKDQSLWSLARAVHAKVQQKMNRPADLYLVLQCYAELDPGLLDAAFISCRGDFPGRAAQFAGGMFFGFNKAEGYSITNLGMIESESIISAYFIPPASPAVRKTQGVLTVNNVLTICSSER